LLCIYSSFEAKFLATSGVSYGDIVFARTIDFKSCFLQGGQHFFTVQDLPLLYFCLQVGMDSFFGFGPVVLTRCSAPTEQAGFV
jgi:hypothetical protein